MLGRLREIVGVPVIAGALLVAGAGALAQQDTYRVEEHGQPPAVSPSAAPLQAGATPRAARLDYVHGNVTWRPDEAARWQRAKEGAPLNAGAQVWCVDGGRAEVRFDDGSAVRIGTGSVVTLQTLYNDAQGEFTELKLTSGLVTVRGRSEHSIYQVDTPGVTVKAAGPSRVRVGVAGASEVAVRYGSATVEGRQGKKTLGDGDYVSVRDGDAGYVVRPLPRPDSWEEWNDERDHALYGDAYPPYEHPRHVVVAPPPSVWFGFDFPIGGWHHGWVHGGWGGWGHAHWR